MSFSYMFKLIIIGDTGSFRFILDRCRKILPAAPIHRSSIQTKTLSYDRSRVWGQNDNSW